MELASAGSHRRMKSLWWRCWATVMSFSFRIASVSTARSEYEGPYNQHLVVSAHDLPPFNIIEKYPNGSIKSYTSSYPDMVYWLAEAFNFTYTLFPDNETEIKMIGSIRSLMGAVTSGKVDINTGTVMGTYERSRMADFSYPMWIAPFKLIAPKPGEASRLFAFLQPFQLEVWVVLFFMLILMTVTERFLAWSYVHDGFNHPSMMEEIERVRRNEPIVYGWVHYFMYNIGVLANHGTYSASINRQSMKVLIGVWLLAATVLVNCYAGIIISAMTVPKMLPPIDSLEDLVRNDDVTIANQGDAILTLQYLNSPNGTYKKVGDQLRRNPQGLLKTKADQYPALLTMTKAIPTDPMASMMMMYQDLMNTSQCRFHIASEERFFKYDQLMMRYKWKYTKAISDKMLVLWETGLNWYYKRRIVPGRVDECLGVVEESAKSQPIKLSDLTSAFLILGFGLGFSIVAFILELVTGAGKKYQHRKLTKVQEIHCEKDVLAKQH